MVKKLSTFLFIFAVGFLATGGVAQARSAYPSTTTVTLNVTGDNISLVDGTITIIVGGTFTLSGGGFDPAEAVGIAASAPSGLRSTPGLLQVLARQAVSDAAADENGNFATSITLDQLGTTILSAIGRASGKTVSLTVTVVATGADNGAFTGSVGTGTNPSVGSITEAGLASTGAALAGPLAIGFMALFAGLALLFFGTRGVRRRRIAQAR